MPVKKVFVTGCFDMLHSGHIAFLQEAATYGDLYVGLGADETVFGLKGRYPVNNQQERKYVIESLACVKQCLINSGSGIMDFINEVNSIKPDVFVVNEDGNTLAKEELSHKMGMDYLVLRRIPHANLPVRSTTFLRKECTMPYRVDLAGGWLDQPYVGKYAPGPVITVSIEPTIEFNERSGMATSTRRQAIKLWQTDIPSGDKEHLAKILFSYENPPGKTIISGSQDALGIVMPGLNKIDYDGDYWPSKITSVHDDSIIDWLEEHLYLVTLDPRGPNYDVLKDTNINPEHASALADAAEGCWKSIMNKDLQGFGNCFRKSFEAQIVMFPNMANDFIFKTINKYKDKAYGWKISGAGGGGYLILVAEEPVTDAMQIKIRRKGL
jgi:cytidyltransferase-like protein